MSLKSFLRKFFLGGEILKEIYSPINGEIRVVEDLFGHREMMAGRVCQSGGLVERVWRIAIRQIYKLQNLSRACPVPFWYRACRGISNCLILGLGCGDAAKLISEKWPEAKIIGVEIDPKVMEVGKKYFGLDKVPNLEIIIDDAVKKILNTYFLILNTKFDLILIDLYIGKEFPEEAGKEEFINGVKNLLSENSVAIFNRLSYGEYNQPANEFAEKLQHYFPKVWTKKAITNLLIFCSQ